MFFIAAFLVSATPGPNMLHILSRSVELGLRGSFPAMAGCLCGLLTLLTASAVGLTALLMALPGAFDVLRYAGTAYLFYLGIKAWRAPVDTGDHHEEMIVAVLSPWKVWRVAYGVSVSNPKAMLFAAAFLPQFINPAAPAAAVRHPAGDLRGDRCDLVLHLCAGGRGLAAHLKKPSMQRLFNRFTGAVFVGFGAILLKSKLA
jgi:threonine/homoserine/homoserine lactone efflux protein